MSLIVWRQGDGYMVEIAPPHPRTGEIRTHAPIPRDDMVKYLESLGVPMEELWQALADAERRS